MLSRLGLALSFLTIIPVPRHRTADARELAQSMAWFPVVGLLLGGVLTGTALGLERFLPAPGSAAILVAVLTAATRALHLDGLADTLDGLGGGSTREDSLRIMKDHAVGAFGAAGMVVALLLKYGLILSLLETGQIHLSPHFSGPEPGGHGAAGLFVALRPPGRGAGGGDGDPDRR